MNEDLDALRRRLAILEAERTDVLRQIEKFSIPAPGGRSPATVQASPPANDSPHLQPSALSRDEKIAIVRSLFRGRDDVFALRFESKRTGRSGYRVESILPKPTTAH